MKILFLSDDFPPKGAGGAAAVAYSVALGFKKRGYEVIVLTAVRNEKDSGWYEVNGIRVYAFQSSYHERWRAYRSLYNPDSISHIRMILEKEKPDIVHAHNVHFYISYQALRLAKKSGAKVILTAHDCMLFHYGKFTEFMDPKDLSIRCDYNYRISPISQLRTFQLRYNPFRNLIIKWYLKSVDKVCAVSRELAKVLSINGIESTLVHNAIDSDAWLPDLDKAKTFVNDNDLGDHKRVLFIGKLTKAKGGHELVEALKLLRCNNNSLKVALIIAGQKDAYTGELLKEAESAGIKSICTGWMQQNQLATVYSIADVVTFPSICFDTFGMVNIEAMASRKPVISTCFGGSKEIVIDNVTGMIINPFNTEIFANNLNDLLTDPQKAKRFGDDGYKRVKEFFDIEIQIDAYEKMNRSE